MADNFDAVEILYGVVSPFGVATFKDKSPEDYTGEHIVINSPSGGPSSFATNDVTVNVNVFLPVTANGMPNRTRFKTIRTGILPLILAANPSAYYCYVETEFFAMIENAKKGFDCYSMRFLLTLNK